MKFKEMKERIESIEADFGFGELFSELDVYDEFMPNYTASQQKELQALIESKKDYFLHCDHESLIACRKEENIPKSLWWWWI